MNFVEVSPELILTPTIEQDEPVNLTPAARIYYTAKAEERVNPIVEVTYLEIPDGVVEGDNTHIKPKIILASTDNRAVMEYAYAFFKSEITPHFIVIRNIEYDMQDV